MHHQFPRFSLSYTRLGRSAGVWAAYDTDWYSKIILDVVLSSSVDFSSVEDVDTVIIGERHQLFSNLVRQQSSPSCATIRYDMIANINVR